MRFSRVGAEPKFTSLASFELEPSSSLTIFDSSRAWTCLFLARPVNTPSCALGAKIVIVESCSVLMIVNQ